MNDSKRVELFQQYQAKCSEMTDSEKLVEIRRFADSGMRPMALAVMALLISQA